MKMTIFDYSFQITDKFSAGHILTDREAMALNGLRAENIRKRVSKKVWEEIESNRGYILSPSSIERLQSIITNYSESYDFHPPSRRTAITPLEIEIEIVAKELADRAARRRGELEATESEVEEWKWKGETQTEARLRLEETRQVAQDGIAEL